MKACTGSEPDDRLSLLSENGDRLVFEPPTIAPSILRCLIRHKRGLGKVAYPRFLLGEIHCDPLTIWPRISVARARYRRAEKRGNNGSYLWSCRASQLRKDDDL